MNQFFTKLILCFIIIKDYILIPLKIAQKENMEKIVKKIVVVRNGQQVIIVV